MFIPYSQAVTFSRLPWLYPLGPSKFVRLNFGGFLHGALARAAFICSQWHSATLRWQNAAADASIEGSISFVIATMKQIHDLPGSDLLACPHQMFGSDFILVRLPSLPVLRPQIRIIRCIQTSGTLNTHLHTHTYAHVLARFMFPSLSCLYHRQLVLLVSSAALSAAKNRVKKKNSPLL